MQSGPTTPKPKIKILRNSALHIPQSALLLSYFATFAEKMACNQGRPRAEPIGCGALAMNHQTQTGSKQRCSFARPRCSDKQNAKHRPEFYMQTNIKLIPTALFLAGALSCFTRSDAPGQTRDDQDGEFLFDKETFGGNGRTCEVCHSKKTGTFSIQDAQARFAKNPNDPLFRAPDSDNGDGQSFTRLLTTGLIKVDVPLAPNVRVLEDPTARTVSLFRATPTVKNVTNLSEFLMADGRESRTNPQHQA